MVTLNRRTMLGMCAAAPALLRAAPGLAQASWPSKPIHIVIPFGAGGAGDTVCRALFARVSETIGQPILIENRTGGNTVVGSQAVLQMPRDGYAFLVTSSQLLVNPVLMTDLPYDAKAFAPIMKIASYPQVLAVRSDFPAKTLEEYVALAKKSPGTITYGTPPAAGMGQFAGELFQKRMGIKLEHVPYRLATEAARDVGGGVLDSVILTLSTIQPPLQSGRVRILAVTSPQRTPTLPDVPTFAERGMPGFDMDDWNGLFAASDVPAPIQARMQAVTAEACRDQTVINRLAALGTVLVGDQPDSFSKFLDEQRTLLTQVIKDANIKLN